MKKQTVSETISQGCQIRPALAPVLTAFEPLFSKRQETAQKLAPKLSEAGIALAARPGETSILKEKIPAGLGPFVREAAQEILPLVCSQQAIAPYEKELACLFTDPASEQDRELLVAALVDDSSAKLFALAEKYGLEAQILDFASEFIISAVLRALTLGMENGDFEDWRRGLCPVCGKPPVIAWLGRRPAVEGNEFLAGGGGKKSLHCGLCGADWHFLRGVCPACGTQGQDAMQILGEEDRRFERIDWCKNCHAYLPQIDLREMAATPDMDAMALCLMHLDMVAAEKELTPLKPSFWNMF